MTKQAVLTQEARARHYPKQCPALLYIADDFGDNSATIHCQLTNGHEGAHHEKFIGREAVVSWVIDERDEGEIDG